MGTPEFAVPSLQFLIHTQEVVGVVTQPDRPAGRGRRLQPPPVKVIAEQASLPIYQPNSMKTMESSFQISEWQPELIVVAAYGQILRAHMLELPARGCLNIHASLLPRWRGASPIQHAILAGDEQTGISLMQMDESMDTGPVFATLRLPIEDEDNAATLHDKLAQAGADILAAHLEAILAGRLVPIPQDDALATYAPLIKKTDGEIDWHGDSLRLDRHVRAMTPWPGAFTFWKGKRLKILAARPLTNRRLPDGPPGRIVLHDDLIIVLGTSGGLQLLTVQLAGKSAMPVDNFVRGQPDIVGDILGK